MPWARSGDTSGMYPKLLAAVMVPGAPKEGAYPMMFGFLGLLATMSAAHLTDYVVDAGTVHRAAGGADKWLMKAALRTGLLTVYPEKVHGVKAYKLIDGPEFLHIREKAEVEWERQQRADTLDLRLSVPVRLRDGDLCRYCGVVTHKMGKASPRKQTLDHIAPADENGVRPPATPATLVVACMSCNSMMRDKAGEARAELQPAPTVPFYSKATAKWLTENGRPTLPTDQLPADSDPAPAGTRAADTPARQRPATADNARAADSDPAPAGHRAVPDHDQGHDPPRLARVSENEVPEDRESSGTGRDGSGYACTPNPAGTAAPPRRRKRSRRGNPPTTPR